MVFGKEDVLLIGLSYIVVLSDGDGFSVWNKGIEFV